MLEWVAYHLRETRREIYWLMMSSFIPNCGTFLLHPTRSVKIINFRTPAVSMIRLLDKAVEQRSLKVDVGEKYTIREAEGGQLIPPSGVEKLMKLRRWSGCPVSVFVQLSSNGRTGIFSMVISWKFAQGPGAQFAFFLLGKNFG
jgi:hypothetical protein